MIKIIATSDWHLGNVFHTYDRRDEHIHFLDWLTQQIAFQQPDLLLIAGDVFDTPNPSAASQELYYEFIDNITHLNPQLSVVIIAGNHDSAARLEAPRALLKRRRVTVKGCVRKGESGNPDYADLIVPFEKADESLLILAIPYLRDYDFERVKVTNEGEECITRPEYGKGVENFLKSTIATARNSQYGNAPLLLLGHLYARESAISETDYSEKLVIGGLEMANLSDADYEGIPIVLGHIHKRQAVGKCNNVRYAGSALPMSFTERDYQHGADLYVYENGAFISEPEFLAYQPLYPLCSIPVLAAPFGEIVGELEKLPAKSDSDAPETYLRINVLLDEPDVELNKHITDLIADKKVRLCQISVTYRSNLADSADSPINSIDDFKELDPLEMIRIRFRNKYQNEMSDELLKLAQQAVNAAKQS